MLLLSKKIRIIFILLFAVASIKTEGQVDIDNSINFVSQQDSLNQIKNIGQVTDSSSLLNFNHALHESAISLKLSGNGLYSFLPPYTGFVFNKGMQLHLMIDTGNIVPPAIIHNLDTFDILYHNSSTVSSGSFKNNSIVRVIFDGQNFKILQYYRNSCPTGFFSVNDNYCIEINERPAAIYSQAVSICNSIGADLCSWAEWYHACVNLNGVSVFNMSNNWEFIGDSSNHSNTVDIVGLPSDGGCLGFYSENLDAFNRNYRCCFKK